MFFPNTSDCPTSFQFVSLQPGNEISQKVTQIGEKHGVEIQVGSQGTFTAPFCGDQYYVQQISLISPSNEDWRTCFAEIKRLEEQMPEGFFQDGN